MTAFRDLLKEDELAAVLTFVRNTWGNQASAIDPKTVARIRAETSGRTIFWKPDELIELHPLEPELMAKDIQEVKEFSNVELEAELLGTAAEALVNAALSEGNSERGKLLFYKSAAACFACHDPPAGTPRIGPDLTQIKTVMKPADLVESVLHPSKQIQKEFAQVTVLMNDGKVTTGIRVSETDDEIVLRNLAQPKPIAISKKEVEEIVESKASLMPDNLVRQLKSRQEFNDLMRYVIQIRKR